jgi:tetratricopeptide (TPR) repeat protein
MGKMLKLKLNLVSLLILIFVLFISTEIFSQETDIVPYLKKIESGNVEEVREDLIDLKENFLNDPSIMFLDGVLTENGQQAVVIYQNIVDNFPESKYADAALYRIYSYYYALGLYETAKEKLKLLSTKYPASPYIQIAEQSVLPGNENVSETEERTDTERHNNQTVSEQDYKFTIQAGAFTNLENAQSLKNDFEKSGILSRIGEKNVGGTTFHIVYAGQFVSYEDAESFLQVINTKFELTGRVVPISW